MECVVNSSLQLMMRVAPCPRAAKASKVAATISFWRGGFRPRRGGEVLLVFTFLKLGGLMRSLT